MEDAHAAILDLQALEGDEELKPADIDVRISYFGVYDGHGGDKVALYTGEHLHKIIAKQESFKKKDFEQALKDGFLAIDRAILSGMRIRHTEEHAHENRRADTCISVDPKYEEEVSGCTSSVGIITKDKIYVVRFRKSSKYMEPKRLTILRETLATPGLFSASKVAQNRCRSTTSRKTKARRRVSVQQAVSSISAESTATLR